MNPDGPGVSVPHEIAAGRNKKVQEPIPPPVDGMGGAGGASGTTADASGDASGDVSGGAATDTPPGPPAGGYAPDPEPLRLDDQWDFTLSYRDGGVEVDSVKRVKLKAPVVTVRKMGRFAIELWVGAELVERVRFDFPLLGAEPVTEPKKDGPRPMREPPRFQVEATLDVRVPASPRATRAVLVDRATGKTTPLDWPPDAPISDPGEGLSGPKESGPPPKSL